MNSLTPFTGGGLPRPIERAVIAERGRGAVAAQKVMVLGVVTETAMHCVANLSSLEAALVRQHPRADGRLSFLVDRGANGMAGEVSRLARGF